MRDLVVLAFGVAIGAVLEGRVHVATILTVVFAVVIVWLTQEYDRRNP